MNKYLVLMICGFLLAGQVLAITPEGQALNDRAAEINKRANAFLLEAESRAIEQCDTTQIVVPFQSFSFSTKSEIIIDVTVSIEWSGGCVDGKRDGDGVLTWIEETTYQPFRMIETWRSEGRFVKGQRLGLWCMTRKRQLASKTPSGEFENPGEAEFSGCSVFAGHAKQLTENYRKQPDGSWMEYDRRSAGSAGGSSLAPGTLEAQSAKVLANAAAGKTDLKMLELVVQNRALDDLVRGSKIVYAPSAAPISLQGKRVAVLLSSRTLSDLERFTREREALITASGGLTGDAAKYRSEFIAASNPDRPLINVAKTVLKYAKSVQPADDLVGLKKGAFDYALIIVWRHMTRFDLLGKFDNSYPKKGENPAPVCESWAAFLVTPDLKAVKEQPATQHCNYTKGKDNNGDFHYMLMLAQYFQSNWGRNPDDAGWSMLGLDYFLKF